MNARTTEDRTISSIDGSVRFEPWVGAKYRSEGLQGVRVLALGESQYAKPGSAGPNFTTEVVRECVFEGRGRFFTKVAKLLTAGAAGEWLSDEVLQDTWNLIAFYNFVQQMLPASRVPPTVAMWKEAQEAFPRVVQELQPQLIVVMGKRLREWFLPPAGVEVCFTEHPSSPRFSYEPWSAQIAAALQRVVHGG